jgi:hypothetical protein
VNETYHLTPTAYLMLSRADQRTTLLHLQRMVNAEARMPRVVTHCAVALDPRTLEAIRFCEGEVES